MLRVWIFNLYNIIIIYVYYFKCYINMAQQCKKFQNYGSKNKIIHLLCESVIGNIRLVSAKLHIIKNLLSWNFFSPTVFLTRSYEFGRLGLDTSSSNTSISIWFLAHWRIEIFTIRINYLSPKLGHKLLQNSKQNKVSSFLVFDS